MRIRNAFEEIFCLRSDISNHDIILPKGQIRKRVWILEYRLDIFWSVIGSGFGEPGGIPPPGIPRRTPPPRRTDWKSYACFLVMCCLQSLRTLKYNQVKQFKCSLQHGFFTKSLLHYTAVICCKSCWSKTKTFNQMLPHLHFAKASILLITQFFSKSTNDIVRRRGSRINTDQFPKQALRGPGVCFWILTFLGFWVIQTGYWPVPFLVG